MAAAMLALPFVKKLLQINTKHPTLVYLLQNSSLKSISNLSESDSTREPSLTISYLINSCGLSPESAISASEEINLKTTQKPDSVLQFFKTHGFSNTQITKLISARPHFLLAHVDTTLKPKMKYFQDLGFSDSEIANLFSSHPGILLRGLETQIIPSIDFLRNLVQTNENVIKAFRRCRWMFTCNLEKRMQPNIAVLKEYQVPDSRITNIVMIEPRILAVKTGLLSEVLERVEEMGFERGSGMFFMAIQAMCTIKKSTWEAKFNLLKSLGWSENLILQGFRRMPLFMRCSEKKIKMGMDFFVNKLKWGPSELARDPMLLMYSLKRRLIPRSKVWNVLKYKELIKEGELKRMLMMSEDEFLKKYVTKYEKEVPYLYKAYRGELEYRWLDGKGQGEDFSRIETTS